MQGWSPKGRTEKTALPALILAWPDDPTHPLAVAEELRELMPNARLDVLVDADDPYLLPQLVREFITSLDESIS